MYYKGEKIERPKDGHDAGHDFHGYGPEIRKEIARLIPKDEAVKALDVGTGFASNIKFLSEHLSKKSKIWTIDSSEEMLESAKSEMHSQKLDKNIEFLVADASHLEFENESFDLIVSVMVLHHIENLESALSEMSRVLKKDGAMILTDYLPSAGKHLDFQSRHHENDFFDPEDAEKILKKSGISKVEITKKDHWYLILAKK